jgi:hypothetical protein
MLFVDSSHPVNSGVKCRAATRRLRARPLGVRRADRAGWLTRLKGLATVAAVTLVSERGAGAGALAAGGRAAI